MSELRPDSVEGVVVRRVDYKDTDRIITLVTREAGRVDARVAGARRSRKRFGEALEQLAWSRLELAWRGGRARVREADLIDGFVGIRSGWDRLAAACYAAEWCERSSRPQEPAGDLLELLLAALRSLSTLESAVAAGWPRAFELKLAHVLGIRPSLRRCAATGAPLGEWPRWSNEAGGALCDEAAPAGTPPLAKGVLPALDQLLRTPLAEVAGLSFDEVTLRRAAELVPGFLVFHTGIRARTRSALDEALASAPLGPLPSGAAPTD